MKMLEEFLAYRIEFLTSKTGFALGQDVPDELRSLPTSQSNSSGRTTLMEVQTGAILRRISLKPVRTLTFASQAHRKPLRKQLGSILEDRYLALAMYPNAKMFHSRIVTRQALIDIAYALKREQKTLR